MKTRAGWKPQLYLAPGTPQKLVINYDDPERARVRAANRRNHRLARETANVREKNGDPR